MREPVRAAGRQTRGGAGDRPRTAPWAPSYHMTPDGSPIHPSRQVRERPRTAPWLPPHTPLTA